MIVAADIPIASSTIDVARNVGILLGVVFWLATVYWVYKDARRRSQSEEELAEDIPDRKRRSDDREQDEPGEPEHRQPVAGAGHGHGARSSRSASR